jgi:predicted Zn-dependent protease with MMP-like domain
VDFRQFERAARLAYAEIPAEFKEGIDGLTVRRQAEAHPTLPDVFTLGHCLTEAHLSEFGGPETTRSTIVLYWGSFLQLSERDDDFDWDGELWETLTHELRHHLESLAGDDALEDVDYAADELFKRQEGLDFDPWYYQRGGDLGGGVYVVEREHYLELPWRDKDVEGSPSLEFAWRGASYHIERPAELGDVHFVWIEGEHFEGDPLELVLVRRRGSWESLGRLVRSSPLAVHESRAQAVRVGANR